jgi:DNA invertase Pin-like site-specific DNA recombinase
MKVFGYGRVSTGQQTTENQRLELEQAGYLIESGYWFADEGISGKVCARRLSENTNENLAARITPPPIFMAQP